MSHNPLELPEDRPASFTTDGSRSYIYPADIKGAFKKYRQLVQGFLMVTFLILPWIEINGHQSILLNIPQRQFIFFGFTFLAHDAPLFFFVLAFLTLGLAFVTSVWGRVWCGWACPQTVFIESVFRRIEKWIEGNHLAQRKLDQEPLHLKKLFKKISKWFLFLSASLLITHSFLAYFVGTNELFQMVRQSPKDNWASFLSMAILTTLILLDFGWFREQFCIIACPYGRFQSVMMDQSTINILYDSKRGEPRKGKVPPGESQGDCVNCYRCVQVCPTGVDIRRGIQLECIACTACIDACDEIMTKVKKPKGLIRYTSEAALAGKPSPLFRPRNFIYLALMVIVVSGFFIATSNHGQPQFILLRAKDIPYRPVTLTNGQEGWINHFTLHVGNQTPKAIDLRWELEPSLINKGISIVSQQNEVSILPDENKFIHLFVQFPKDLLKESSTQTIDIKFITLKKEMSVSDQNSMEISIVKAKLLGPQPKK